jgi:hypothetical protein
MPIYTLKSITLLLLFLSITIDAKPLRIMTLGDSITYGNSRVDEKGNAPRHVSERYTYRGPLWKKLKDAKISFDFVGSKKSGQAYDTNFDPNNDGYPGETSFEIAERTYDLVKEYTPDVILLHIGSNDEGTDMGGVKEILEMIDTHEGAHNTSVHVIIALIIDKKPSSSRIKNYNVALKALVTKRWKSGDKLTLVDMYKGAKLTKNDYVDGIHPSKSGYNKMADVWFKALTTPYKAYSQKPIAKDDKIEIDTGSVATINVVVNDIDYQKDIDISSVFFKNNTQVLEVTGEGQWEVSNKGIVTFTPNKIFTSDPTPITYTIKDTKKNQSKPAKITINYRNKSLEAYPTSIVNKTFIESQSIDEASNSITFITRIPNSGIKFQ